MLDLQQAWIPRRVLMTADAGSEVWTYALDLSAALGRRGVEVVLATLGAPLARSQRSEADRLGLRIHTSAWRTECSPGAWPDVDHAGDWLEELAAVESPDLIHLNGYCHAARGWNAPVVVVGHTCVWSWWRAVLGEDPPAQWREYYRQVSAGLRAADRVVAPTRARLATLEQIYGPLPHARVVPSGRERAIAGPRADRPKQPFVLAAGRLWDEAGNLLALDRVAPRVGWPIVVAGDAASAPGDRPRPRHIALLGRLSGPELSVWLDRAGVFAAPARHQPYGLTALEAGLAGCALVLGDIASAREVWGDAARYVPPDSDGALAEVLGALSERDDVRAELGRAARARALAFDSERMADGYLAVYREAARATRPQAGTPAPHARRGAKASP